MRMTAFLYSLLPPLAQDVLVSVAGVRRRRLRFSPHFDARLRFLTESDGWPMSDLAAYQEEQLRLLVEHAYSHVPYYRRAFDELRLRPSDIRTVEDLRKLPVLEKETVRAQAKDFVSRAFRKRSLIAGHTSGTTGAGLRLLYERRAVAEEFAAIWRLRRRLGLGLSDPFAVFRGLSVVPVRRGRPPFWRRNLSMNQILFSQYHTRPENLPSYAEELERCGTVYYEGYPSFMSLLADHLVQSGTTLSRPPRAALTSSETLFDFQRRTIERGFGTRVHDRYGNAELCCSMIECERGRLHLDMEFGIAELDVKESGDGWETGDLICTGFANYAMPFLRYRTGDVATRMTRACECGRERTAFFRVDGRVEDYVVTPSGVRVGRMDHVFKDLTNVREAQIVQDEPGAIRVRVVRRSTYGTRDENKLREELQSRLGEEMGIEVEYADEIEREPNGKFRLVKSSLIGGRLREP